MYFAVKCERHCSACITHMPVSFQIYHTIPAYHMAMLKDWTPYHSLEAFLHSIYLMNPWDAACPRINNS